MSNKSLPWLPNELWLLVLDCLAPRDVCMFIVAYPEKIYLLRRRDCKRRDYNNNYIIHFAASRGEVDIVKRILTFNSGRRRLDYRNTDARTPLCLAAERGYQSVVELLLNHPTIRIGRSAQFSAFMYAAAEGHEEIVRLLLPRPGVIDDVIYGENERASLNFYSPVIIAARRDYVTIFQLLTDAEPSLAVASVGGETPFYNACRCGSEGIVKYMLEKFSGIHADERDTKGSTLLMKAAKRDYDGVVELLLDRSDVDPNASDNRGWSPLMSSVRSPAAAKVLLAHGRVDVNLATTDSLSALTCAIRSGELGEEVLVLLLDHPNINVNIGFSSRPALHVAVLRGTNKAIKMLLDRDDIDIKRKDSRGRTALHHAARKGYIEVVQLFYQKMESMRTENIPLGPAFWRMPPYSKKTMSWGS